MRFPIHSESTELHDLADAVADTAAGVWSHIARAFQLRQEPSGAVITCERDLWRWAHTLRQAARDPVPDHSQARQVAVVLLVELEMPRDLCWLARAVVNTGGRTGDGWRILHASTHPNPTAVVTIDRRHQQPR